MWDYSLATGKHINPLVKWDQLHVRPLLTHISEDTLNHSLINSRCTKLRFQKWLVSKDWVCPHTYPCTLYTVRMCRHTPQIDRWQADQTTASSTRLDTCVSGIQWVPKLIYTVASFKDKADQWWSQKQFVKDKKWLFNPVISSQSEGYNSHWLIWLVCGETPGIYYVCMLSELLWWVISPVLLFVRRVTSPAHVHVWSIKWDLRKGETTWHRFTASS